MFRQTNKALGAAALAACLLAPVSAQPTAQQDYQLYSMVESVRLVDAKCDMLNPVERISAEQTLARLAAILGEATVSQASQNIQKAVDAASCDALLSNPNVTQSRPYVMLWERDIMAAWTSVLGNRKRDLQVDLVTGGLRGDNCGPFEYRQLERLEGAATSALQRFQASPGYNQAESEGVLFARSQAIIAQCTASPFDPDTPHMRLLAAQMDLFDAAEERR